MCLRVCVCEWVDETLCLAQIFNLKIVGKVGSKRRRLKHVTYWFWGIFWSVLALQAILFLTRAQEGLTNPPDDGER